MMFDLNTFDDYKKITDIDIEQLLTDFVLFMDKDYPKIVSYYKGTSSSPNGESFSRLSKLRNKIKTAINVFNTNKERFYTIADWNLLEQMEDVYTRLETTNNLSVYLRSSIVNGKVSSGIEKSYTLSQFETIENTSAEELKDIEPQNDWAKVALRSNLIEEDYTPDGGGLLSITFENNPNLTFINSVVDNIEGEKMYGLDIDKKISFEDNDVKVLNYKNTVRQAIDILSNLRKGDNPLFPEDGIKSSLVVGNTIAGITYPLLFRQLYNTFAADDTLTSFSIIDVKQYQDTIELEFAVNTKLGETITNKIQI